MLLEAYALPAAQPAVPGGATVTPECAGCTHGVQPVYAAACMLLKRFISYMHH